VVAPAEDISLTRTAELIAWVRLGVFATMDAAHGTLRSNRLAKDVPYARSAGGSVAGAKTRPLMLGERAVEIEAFEGMAKNEVTVDKVFTSKTVTRPVSSPHAMRFMLLKVSRSGEILTRVTFLRLGRDAVVASPLASVFDLATPGDRGGRRLAGGNFDPVFVRS